MNQFSQTLKVLIIGSREVGKTKLLDRLMQKPFSEAYSPTQNQFTTSYTLQLQSTLFNLDITEMNKIPFKLFEASPFPQFDYIIFVYDLSRSSTWHDVKKYKEQIEKYFDKSSSTKCFIIGNKADKEKLMDINKVSFFAPHIEISAKSEGLNQKQACKQIWNNAFLFKEVLQKPIVKPEPEYCIEMPFETSIPTSITKLEGTCNIKEVIKVIFVGGERVGKSAINSLIANQPFHHEYLMTIGVNFLILNIACHGKRYKIQCWDTAGQEKFRNITRCYYKNVNICYFVYDITRRESFEQIKGFYEQIAKSNTAPASSLFSAIIGNKCDLENERKVSFEEGANLAEQFKIKFYEVSVKERHGALEAFLSTLENFINEKKL